MTPAERHAVVLSALAYQRRHLDVLGAPMRRQVAADDGRRRILERHAPSGIENADGTQNCGHEPCAYFFRVWPCDDWADAAAGLLPEAPA